MNKRLEYTKIDPTSGEYIYMSTKNLYIPDNLSNPTSETGVKKVYNLEIDKAPGWSYQKNKNTVVAIYTPDFQRTIGTKSLVTIDSKKHTVSFKCAGVSYNLHTALFFSYIFPQINENIIRSYLGLDHGHSLFTSISSLHLQNISSLKEDNKANHKVKRMFINNLVVRDTQRYRDIFSLNHLPAFMYNNEEIHSSTREYINKNPIQSMQISGIDSSFNVKLYTPTDYSKLTLTPEYLLGILSRLFLYSELDIIPNEAVGSGLYVVSLDEKITMYNNHDRDQLDEIMENSKNYLFGVEQFKPEKMRLNADVKKHDSNLIEVFDGENVYSSIRDSGKTQVVRTSKTPRMEEQLVNPSVLSILDTVDVSEKENIGNNTPLTILSTSRDGVVFTSLKDLKTGLVNEYSAAEIFTMYVAEHNADFNKTHIPIRYKGEVNYLAPSVATHQLVSPFASMSYTRSASIYPENADLKRSQMTAVALKQSRSIIKPSRPLVSSGSDSIIANNEGPVKAFATVQDVFEEFWEERGLPHQDLSNEKFLLSQSASSLKHGIQYIIKNQDLTLTAAFVCELEKGGSKSVNHKKVHPVNGNYYIHTDILWSIPSFHVSKADTTNTDALSYHDKGDPSYWDKGIGTGFTANVMYGFYKSLTVDDACVVSDKFIRNFELHTPRTIVTRIPKSFYAIGGFIGKPQPGFNANGTPKEGTFIKPGFPVFYYVQSKKQRCVYLKPSDSGEVFSVQEFSKGRENTSLTITLYNVVELAIADKFSGRHGNKTLCAKIIPHEHMPYDPTTGESVDFILNPLSPVTRANLGQIPELYASLKQRKTGDTKIEPPYTDKFLEYIKESVGTEDVYERRLVDGESGVLSDIPFFVGPLYMLRLVQLAADKIKSVGDAEESDMDNAFGSPVGVDPHNRRGQSLGAYEFDLLYSLGARKLLDEALSIMSTDIEGRRSLIKKIKEEGHRYVPSLDGVSQVSENLTLISRALYLKIDVGDEGTIAFSFSTDDDNRKFNKLESSKLRTSLMDTKICETFTYFEIDFKFLNPVAYSRLGLAEVLVFYNLNTGEFVRLTSKRINMILSGEAWFAASVDDQGNPVKYYTTTPSEFPTLDFHTGAEELIALIENTEWEEWKSIQESTLTTEQEVYKNLTEAVDRLGGIKAIISKTIPVVPLKYRLTDKELKDISFFTAGYWNLYTQSTTFSDFNTKHARFLSMFNDFFLGSGKEQDVKSIKEYLFFKEKDGKVRNNITKRRLLYSMRANILPQLEYHPDNIVLPFQHVTHIFSPFVLSYMHHWHREFATWNDFDLINLVAVLPNLRLHDIVILSKGLISTQPHVTKIIRDLTELLETKYVHYNRAPALQESSVRAGRVKVHFDGDFLSINTTLTEDQNADFDGDQEPVFAVFSEEAQDNCIDYLLPSANLFRSNDIKPSLKINQDALLGLYLFTKDQTPENEFIYQFYTGDSVLTSIIDRKISKNSLVKIGDDDPQLACNVVLDYVSEGYEIKDRVVTKKSLDDLILEIAFNNDSETATNIINNLLILGYKMIHLYNLTLSIKDFQPILSLPTPEDVLLPKFLELLDLRSLGLLPENITSHVQVLIDEYNSKVGCEEFLPKDNNLYTIIKSGAKGNFGRLNSIFGVKGVVESNDGYFTTPIFSSYTRGISQIASDSLNFTQRKNAYATVEGTKIPGALFRTSSFLLYDMVVKPPLYDNDPDHHIFYLPDGTVDPVFKKLIDNSNDDTYDVFFNAIESQERITKAKTPLNDFRPDGGVSYDHQIGSITWNEGTLVGMKAATAMSETTTQMTISRRHYESGQDTSALVEYTNLVEKGVMYGDKKNPYKTISIFAPFDGYFYLRESLDETFLCIDVDGEVYHIVLDLPHTLHREYLEAGYVRQGDCLSYIKNYKDNPYEAIHPILSTNFYIGTRNNDRIACIYNPNSYQLQFARFAVLHFLCDVYASMSGDIAFNHLTTYAAKLVSLGTLCKTEKIDYIGAHIETGEDYYVSMFAKVKLLFHTTGPMTAYLYQKPFHVGRLSVTAGAKPDKSHMTKMIFSTSMEDDDNVMYKLPDVRKSNTSTVANTNTSPVVIVEDIVEEEQEDVEIIDNLMDIFMASDQFQSEV